MLDKDTFSALLESAIKEPGIVSKAYSAFYGYSIGNQLYAMFQCSARGIELGPIATFMGWKDKGRYVRKGEKAIALCMPVTCKGRKDTDAPDGEKSATFTRFVFRSNWFVLSQTDGNDAQPITIPEWNAATALTALDIAEVPFSMTDGNCQGYAMGRSIAVSPLAEYPHKTRFHELAHVVLGHTAEAVTMNDDDRTPKTLREVEAEAVAMVCGEALNLPGSAESRGYIQHWNQTRTGEGIPEKSAQRIFKAADTILRAGRGEESR
jgi:hypothetical protein